MWDSVGQLPDDLAPEVHCECNITVRCRNSNVSLPDRALEIGRDS